MTLKRMAPTLLFALCLGLGAGCGGQAAAPVSLAGDWSTSGEFAQVNRRYTRHHAVNESFAEVIKVYGVLLTPEWRTARVGFRRDREQLSAETTEALLASEKAADGAYHEVMLLVTTHDRQENDLHRGARATWKVTLIDGNGKEYPAVDVIRDRRPRKIIRAEYPDFGDFAVAYLARFPREATVYGDPTQPVRVRVASSRGTVMLEWSAR